MSRPCVAVVIPHFQRREGLLSAALRSAFAQTVADKIVAIVVDDGSPSSAAAELQKLPEIPRDRVRLIERRNGGAGAARNTALNNVPAGVDLVAFLDSDDCWRPSHLENAIRALDIGFDAYFADFFTPHDRTRTNFERIGQPPPQQRRQLDDEGRLFELRVTPIQHIVQDGGGLIQTSTVVYRYDKFRELRFREEFYNGQDFFFWMDLGALGARFAFSLDVGCENGEGVNIYQGSGWGSERSLQRLRNELFVWTSVGRFYSLTKPLRDANRRTIRNLQRGVVRDVLHRLRTRQPISTTLLRDIVHYDPSIIAIAPLVPLRIVGEKVIGKKRLASEG